MFSPWVILAVVLAFAGSNAFSFFKGESRQEDKDRAQYATDLESTIKKANDQAEADKQAAIKVAARNAAAQARAATIRSQASVIIHEKPLPVVCDWEPKSFGLLVSAVQAANGADPATDNGLSTAVQRANAPSKQQR